jgi:hypothetical protein
VGDVVGQVLDKGLSPLGHVIGAVGNTNGQAFLDVEEMVKEKVGYTEEKKRQNEKPGGERIGGNPQTGQNPLGL